MAGEVIQPALSQLGGGSQSVSKTVTFTGAANLGAVGAVPLFTTAGTVVVRDIVGVCGTTLASTGAATLSLGSTNQVAGFIAATTATNITSTNSIWVSTTPTRGLLDEVAGVRNVVVTENIIGTVAAAAVSAGVLTVTVIYDPLGPGGGSLS